jgi:hypothetical protein
MEPLRHHLIKKP